MHMKRYRNLYLGNAATVSVLSSVYFGIAHPSSTPIQSHVAATRLTSTLHNNTTYNHTNTSTTPTRYIHHTATNMTLNDSTSSTEKTLFDPSQSHLWDGVDKNVFASPSHPGYALESDGVTKVGGWLAHRQHSEHSSECWIRDIVASKLTRYEYCTMPIGRPPRILVLYGSLRPTSFSRKTAYELARLLETLDCDVRVYNPQNLPVRDPSLDSHSKVLELRALTHWSDGHVWVSPEMHGTITGVFKNQIDWIPLNTGSVRPTQGKTCLVAQVNGGSQSFNAVNALRLLARWMRMPCCTNQSSIAKAWKEFDDQTTRMKDSSFRDRVVDCAEEFAKFTALMAPVSEDLTDRYSERREKEEKGKLLTQAEKELQKTVNEARKS